MIEILTYGNVEKEFNKLGVGFRQTYKGEEYGVCEVTDDEFKILCDDSENDPEEWKDGGWGYCKGSNQGEVNNTLTIKGQELKCWYEPDKDELEELEEGEEYYKPQFNSLLEYLCDHMGCSALRNVCALTKDLAKYNNIKLSELFIKYEG